MLFSPNQGDHMQDRKDTLLIPSNLSFEALKKLSKNNIE